MTLLVAALYPFAIAYGNFAGIEPIAPVVLWRTVLGSWAATFLLYAIARLIIRDADARTLWLGILLLAFGAYALAIAIVRANGMDVMVTSRPAAVLFVVVAVALATAATRPWQRRTRDLVPLVLVAFTLVGINIYRGEARIFASPPAQWRSAADGIVGAPARASQARTASRDIYYIVLDGFGRPDKLREFYNLEIDEFVSFLEARGFYVAKEARSNYAHSFLSFGSFLNLGYLDSLGQVMGRESTSWLPLGDVIQQNALMRLAKQAGFTVMAIGSDYGPTKSFAQADVCDCRQRGLDIFEQVAIGMTPLAALPLDRWTYGAHREKVLGGFSALEQLPPSQSGRLIVAHILAPHPPFVFKADGTARRPDRAFMFNEGSDFPGSKEEYVEGYRDQVEFMAQRLTAVIDAILRRPGPPPAIVIHGDHGPGSMLKVNDRSQTNLDERMSIFAAYYLPEAQAFLYPSITPVNAVRVLANQYLGTNLPRLPDVSWFSTAEHPYDFTVVAGDSAAGRD